MKMKSMSMYSTQYLVGAPFAWITAAMQRGMESISLWHWSGARFTKEVQPTLSLNLNSELSYSEMGNWVFSYRTAELC